MGHGPSVLASDRYSCKVIEHLMKYTCSIINRGKIGALERSRVMKKWVTIHVFFSEIGRGQRLCRARGRHSSVGASSLLHTSSLLSIVERPSARMILIGSRGDILGSVASCPGLRVQYWKLWSEKGKEDEFSKCYASFSLRQNPGPSSNTQKKTKREETEEATGARTRVLVWDRGM